MLQHASVFADGFDLAAITQICGSFDEYVTLDLVDSLVRKSLVTTRQSAGPRLYVAASGCMFLGRPEDGVGYAQAASVLHDDPGYQPFDIGWAGHREASAHFYAGRTDRFVEICTTLATRTGLARVAGPCGLAAVLLAVGRSGEAMAIADDALDAARALANPFWIAAAYFGCGAAFTETDPVRALDTFRLGLAYTRQHRLPFFESLIASATAGLEAVHGDLDQALTLPPTDRGWLRTAVSLFVGGSDLGSESTLYGDVETRRQRPYPDVCDRRFACCDRAGRNQERDMVDTGVVVFVVVGQRRTQEPVGPLLGEGSGFGEHDRHRREPDLSLGKPLCDNGGPDPVELEDC